MSIDSSIKSKKIALIGNPNSGKSTLFNALTGQKQRVGNFSGVTVDKKTALIHEEKLLISMTDFPGLYSIHPISYDEKLVTSILTDPAHNDYPDHIIYTVDYRYLEEHLLLYTQLKDLGFDVMLTFTMADQLEKDDITIFFDKLEDAINDKVYLINSRDKTSVDKFRKALKSRIERQEKPLKAQSYYKLTSQEKQIASQSLLNGSVSSDYQKLLRFQHKEWLPKFQLEGTPSAYDDSYQPEDYVPVKAQIEETFQRFDKIKPIAHKVKTSDSNQRRFTDKLDRVLTHKVFGPIIFFGLMTLVFQAIFAWAEYPMTWIEDIFAGSGSLVRNVLPDAWYTDLLVDGVIAGLGGVVVFVPQIAILFFFIALLEEIGYMSRAVYLFDNLMRRFGLNGRSVVALISSGACAIPAIMSTRTIQNWQERLLTIMVTPFISCSARIPVYAVLVAFVVPSGLKYGPFNAQGIIFLGLYLLGIIAALGSAYVFKLVIGSKTQQSSLLVLDMPEYQKPYWKNVYFSVQSKVLSFIKEAGKIILIISIILWFLASYGMPGKMQQAEMDSIEYAEAENLSQQETENLIASNKLEASFAGDLGHLIEPVIEPLGFDWKIGIALITSFAAREVFVGTMATIYNIGSSDDELRISQQMGQAINRNTGQLTFTMPVSMALLVFYALAMQCMSTLAVVRKETGTWKWPVIQFVYMTALAYICAWFTYVILS